VPIFEADGSVNTDLLTAIGQAVPRKEDDRLITGKGRFTDDFNAAGQAYVAMVRSTYPHAKILSIDTDAAASMPGVLGVFIGADCKGDGLGVVAHSPVPSTRTDLKLTSPTGGDIFVGPQELLPENKVRFVGEAVAMVVAKSRCEALDAAEAVFVDYEALESVSDSEAAAAPGAPVVWEEVPDNICCDTTFGDPAGTERAFEKAEHRFAMHFRISRVTGVPLEPRGALGLYDGNSGRYTLYAGSNGAVRHKQQIAAALQEDPESLRILCHDVGGNFGTKNRVYVEFCLVLWAARKLGCPVKFTATRSDSFISDLQGRDLVSRVEIAIEHDGRFLAYRASNLSNVGSRVVSLSPLGKGIAIVTGAYDFPVATARARAVFTNTVPTQAYRSSGRPEVTHALERLIDIAADKLNIDPIALRRKNLISTESMPYQNPLGIIYDSGDYDANMTTALELAEWDDVPARRAAAKARGLRYGIGFANYVESSIGSPRERVELYVEPEGRVRVVIGTQPTGQGHETSFAQVVADLLGLTVEDVDIITSDTDIVTFGGGSHSGRSMRHAGTVICLAAEVLISRARQLTAFAVGGNADDVQFSAGRFSLADASYDWFTLAQMSRELELPDDLSGGLAVIKDNEMHTPVFPNGCAVCEVEIDPETGVTAITRYVSVDDVGRVINPIIVDGQTHGSIAQGVGQALCEQFLIDPESGQPLTGSFMDYAIPRADDLPSFTTAVNEVPSPTNPLGIKSAGEGPTTPALAVVVNAIVNALREDGVDEVELPATPYRVWELIQRGREQRHANEGAL
jgi:aerobic carbon-monoxide dehydrogenase large subunit